ncbi:MAG: T9SS type A sorting domain-containing protein [Ignavibacteriales bacterium]|nr:T9SS type A sorting domain-containing protein [Ignavibacteriales bacterium]
MKRSLLSSIIVLSLVVLSATEIFSQWVPQTSGITTRLRYIKAVNDNVLWACGNSGVVLKTTDGGTTWVPVTSPNAGSTMYTIDAFDATTAWVTGTVGGSADVSIWKTTDGGTSWVSQYNNPTGFGDGLRMFDANNGVYYGDPDPVTSSNWEILTTTNGGTNWNRVPAGNYPPADSVAGEVGVACNLFTLGNTVWFSSYTAAGTTDFVYKSDNNGLNWTRSSFPGILGGSSFISFKDPLNGLIVCLDNTIAMTDNGGSTWTTSSLAGVGFRSIVNVPTYSAYVTVGSSGVSNYTKDNGATWIPLTTGTTQTLYWVATTGNYCWAVGNAGTILKLDGVVLPVELTSFTAVSQNQQVTLNWSTATEINNNGFEIQRSSANSEFVTVGFVKGAGTTTEQKEYSFTDKNLQNGIYSYRLKQIDYNGAYEYSEAIEVDVRSLDTYTLEQNYPNPFNPTTKIGYVLSAKTNVKVVVMNAIGEQIAVLVNQTQEQGYHQLTFNATNLPSGIYFYSLQTENFSETKKMLLMK